MVKLYHLASSIGLAYLATAAALPVTETATCKNPIKRLQWRQISIPQKRSYIDAVLCLKHTETISDIPGTVNRFDDFYAVHIDQSDHIHFVGAFLLWHRYFVATYEKTLREECGYTGAQPYWDYSLDAEPHNPTFTRIFDSEVVQPDTGFGGDGKKAVPNPERNPSNLTGGTGGGCVQDGPFVPKNFMVNYPGPPECLRSDFMPTLLNSWADPQLVTNQLNAPDYVSFDRTMQGQKIFEIPNIHGSGDFGVGGVLGQAGNAARSPAEPLFYVYHGNLDHIFWMWQQRDLETRLSQVQRLHCVLIQLWKN